MNSIAREGQGERVAAAGAERTPTGAVAPVSQQVLDKGFVCEAGHSQNTWPHPEDNNARAATEDGHCTSGDADY